VSLLVSLLATTLSGLPGRVRRIECFGLQGAVNDSVSDIDETLIVVASVMAKPCEGLLLGVITRTCGSPT
jgi:hypothetical protein